MRIEYQGARNPFSPLTGAPDAITNPQGSGKIIMLKDFSELQKEVLAANVDFNTINNIKVDANMVYKLGFKAIKDSTGKDDWMPALVTDAGQKFSGSIQQIAGLRLITGTNVVTKWTHEFETEPTGTRFQYHLHSLPGGTLLDSLSFKCVGQMKILNRVANTDNTPVYRDDCYSGYATFKVKRQQLRAEYAGEKRLSAEYRDKLRELNDTLRSSTLIAEKATDANLELIPVFKLV